jgi:hypothetical protein
MLCPIVIPSRIRSAELLPERSAKISLVLCFASWNFRQHLLHDGVLFEAVVRVDLGD